MKTMKERYAQEKPIGGKAVLWFHGLLVFMPKSEDDNCDYVTCFETDGKRISFRRSTVRYSNSSRPYIYRGKSRYYLDEIERYYY